MDSKSFAKEVRKHALRMVYQAKASHIGGVLSSADIISVLYSRVLTNYNEDPRHPERDRFILSKGHCCAGVYAALAMKGYFSIDELRTFAMDGSRLMSHINHHVPGVEFSTGSLGHGLPFAVGKALAAKKLRQSWRTFTLISDGELNEGINWEAIMFAAHHNLNNLIAIIDYNKLQSLTTNEATLKIEPLAKKFEAFGWFVIEIDGHNHTDLYSAFSSPLSKRRSPTMVIAHTIKGKGVGFMENKVEWHYKSPDSIQLQRAIFEIEHQS